MVLLNCARRVGRLIVIVVHYISVIIALLSHLKVLLLALFAFASIQLRQFIRQLLFVRGQCAKHCSIKFDRVDRDPHNGAQH